MLKDPKVAMIAHRWYEGLFPISILLITTWVYTLAEDALIRFEHPDRAVEQRWRFYNAVNFGVFVISAFPFFALYASYFIIFYNTG